MTFPDLLRFLALALFFFVLAQALVINWRVWRLGTTAPAGMPSLLAWHVHAVTLYALGMHAVLVGESVARLGDSTANPWRLAALLLFGIAGNAAMYLIGNVTAARRRLARSL